MQNVLAAILHLFYIHLTNYWLF